MPKKRKIETIATATGCSEIISHKPKKHGYIILNRNGKRISAHRYSYEKNYGSIPKGKMILHHCDNKICINPKHLYLGDHSQNMKDMVTRNRQAYGSQSSQSYLTTKEVLQIRNLCHDGISDHEIADRFNIPFLLVNRIVTGRTWKYTEGYIDNRGRNFHGKLREENIKEIRQYLKQKISCREIAIKYGVSRSTIQDIKSGKTWNLLKAN